jgi:hypothetical protein
MASKAFTAKTFTWLRQINRGRYLAIDLKVALELTTYFNERDQDGRAFPSYKTIGDAIGVSEQTVIRSIERMRAHGDLHVTPGKAGRGHPNQYWMVVKPAQKTSTVTQVFDEQKKPPSGAKKTSKAVQENPCKNPNADGECLRTPPSVGERVRTSCESISPDPGRAALEGAAAGSVSSHGPTARPSPGKEQQATDEENAGLSHGTANLDVLDHAWHMLRELWQRGHVSDSTPCALAIAKRAFFRACESAEPADILAGARATVAVCDAPRYLPRLAEWLDANGWQHPPPTKRVRERGPVYRRNHQSRHNGRPNMTEVGQRLAAWYRAADDGENLGAVS